MAGTGLRIALGVALVGGVIATGVILAPGKPTPPPTRAEPSGQETPELADEVAGTPELEVDTVPAREPFEQGRLLVGDPAPLIDAEHWYQGEPRSRLALGSVHVVDLWATWCGPCVRAMPHLSKLQNKYADQGLKVIAVSIDTGDSAHEQVQRFLERRSEDISFDVVLDAGGTKSAWLDTSGRDSIPSTYVVDRNGTVVWIGNPNTPEGEFGEPVIDRVLREIMSDTYDVAEAVDEARAEIMHAREAQKRTERVQELTEEMGSLWGGGDVEGALTIIDEIVSLEPENNSGLALRKAEVLLYERNKPEEASAFFVQMIDGPYFDDNETLLSFVNLFTGDVDPGDEGREAAVAAAELVVSRQPHPEHILVLARAQFAAGNQDEAVKNAIWARDFFDYGSGEYEFFDRYVRQFEQVD
ncbi:MAG: hypothetical protein ED559_05720 [Phycisphaera sp.]|nr:MAG: hypothetical protein ED559_05720 [Phycisphaera sp.]